MTLTESILSLHPAARFGVDFVVGPSGDPISGTLGPDAVTKWDEGALGKRDDAAIAAAMTAGPPAAVLTSYAASARYTKETAGITVGTAQIATDRDSQGMITGMWAAAQINPQIQVSFKSVSGFVTIGAAQVAKIATAVAAYVQACFTAEGQVVAGITAGTIKTTADVDKALAAVVSVFPGTSSGGTGATAAAGTTGASS